MKKNFNRLKVVLIEQKRTNRWLADQLNKDEATISKWCTSTSRPSLETLFAIAKVLGMQVQDIIEKR